MARLFAIMTMTVVLVAAAAPSIYTYASLV